MATRTPDHAATIGFPLWRNSRIVKLDNRGIHVSIVEVMLIQICSLFVREYFRLVLNNAGFSEPQSKHLSALVGFLIQLYSYGQFFVIPGQRYAPSLADLAIYLGRFLPQLELRSYFE